MGTSANPAAYRTHAVGAIVLDGRRTVNYASP
jgi:hypothetical protein